MINSPYDVMNATMRRKLEKEAKKKKAAKARLKAEPSSDELLSWYASQPKHNLGVSSDDIIIKNKNIPYADTIIKIEEKLKVVDYTEEKKQLNQSFNTKMNQNVQLECLFSKWLKLFVNFSSATVGIFTIYSANAVKGLTKLLSRIQISNETLNQTFL